MLLKHSAILSTFIKLPFVVKTLFLAILDRFNCSCVKKSNMHAQLRNQSSSYTRCVQLDEGCGGMARQDLRNRSCDMYICMLQAGGCMRTWIRIRTVDT